MSIELSLERKVRIDEQISHLEDCVSELDLNGEHPITQLVDQINEAQSKAERRQLALEETVEQSPTEEQLRRVYTPYLNYLNNVESRVEDLQHAVVYFAVNEMQHQGDGARLRYTQSVCDELNKRFQIEAEYLPVIWSAYAAFDIVRKDFYAIHIPRDNRPILGAPILGHELGHAVADHLQREDKRNFQRRVESLASEFKPRQREIVRTAWREWFYELLCDACGALTFGPAYLVILTRRLLSSYPHNLPEGIAGTEHPPDELRYRFVRQLLDQRLADWEMDVLDRHISNFDQHLEISKESKPTEYDDWIDPEILSIIETISLDYINLDIKELMEETLGESEISPCRSRRIEVNKHILGIKTADKIEEYH